MTNSKAKQVLVIGGSYFVGRVFSILCSRGDEFELHVVNRGKAPINKENVHEYICDRHDVDKFAEVIPDIHYDAVVDFCGYNPGEIAPIIDKLHDKISQYIFISTASVYVDPNSTPKTEDDPILYESDDDMITQYICNKSLLEKELIEKAGEHNIPYTIARPSFIYGPFNYAPRESWYIKKIANNQPIDVLSDGSSHFNFVYVTDVATAMQLFVGSNLAYNQIFNLANPEVITEKKFVDELDKLHGSPLPKIEHTVEETFANTIAIPWPLTEDELYDGSKFAKTFDFTYTSFDEGMQKTYKSFMNVYAPRN